MANAVLPIRRGQDYQARIFWYHALRLLDRASGVMEVTFEATAPKGFDDLVVKYESPIPGSGPVRVSADYYQVKWHVHRGGRFGFADLVVPGFIGAKKFSLLRRLADARAGTGPGSRFVFVTTDRIRDGDPLGALVSGEDRSLRVERLFDGSPDMGQVRELWREHLRLSSDNELRDAVDGFCVQEGYDLQEMRYLINERAKSLGLAACSDSSSDFRFDELAFELKKRKLNVLTRERLERLCHEEGLYAHPPVAEAAFLPVAIRSFTGPSADIPGATPADTLLLTGEFEGRLLREGRTWQGDIRPRVEGFLRAAVKKSHRQRLILDTHASISFLAGFVLDRKSGVAIELVQKGAGSQVWRLDEGSDARGAQFTVAEDCLGPNCEIGVAISLSHSTEDQARAYAVSHLPGVGRLVRFNLPGGPGQQSVAGGAHAFALADQASRTIRAAKSKNPDAVVHVFAAGPNSFLFYLGQLWQGIAPCIVYEFDFDRRGNRTYQPSFVID